MLLQMSGIFQFAVRMHAELESKLTSVERLDYYIKVKIELNYIGQLNIATKFILF